MLLSNSSSIFSFRLSRRERTTLELAATRLGLSTGLFTRRAAISAARKVLEDEDLVDQVLAHAES